MKLEISKIKLALKWLTGGMGGVTDYLLDRLNNALIAMDAKQQKQVQAVANYAEKVSATLSAFAWLVPTKWQTAYSQTLSAVSAVSFALADLKLEADEFASIEKNFLAAVAAWKGGDDETCQDCVAKEA